ncbi:MAG: hypothetical protein JXB88_21695, partial [Spirochaetales bacterium]|nr:hypothetical protein [Spirochaetales bacterium]
ILSGSDVITGINYFLLLLIWVVGVANAVSFPGSYIVILLIYFSKNLASNYNFSYHWNVDFVIILPALSSRRECHISANRLLQ